MSTRLTLAVIKGFSEVGDVDFRSAVEVGDSLGDFDNFKVGTSREIEFLRGGVEKSFGDRSEFEYG